MTKIARELGFETFKTASYLSKGHVRQKHVTKLPPGPQLIRLYESKSYWTFGRLAKRFRVKRSRVQQAIHNARKAEGLS